MLRVTAVFDAPGGPYYSTDHYGGTTSGEAVQAALATHDFWFQLQNFLTSSLVMRPITVAQLVDVATGDVTDEFPAPAGGITFTGSGEPLPWASQGLLSLRTATFIAGRRVRGRKFIPGCLETMSVAGDPSGATLAAIENAWDHAQTTFSGSGGPRVYSTTHFQEATVTGRICRPYWAVLRTRRSTA